MIVKNLLVVGWLAFLGVAGFLIVYTLSKEVPPDAPSKLPSIIVESPDHSQMNLRDIQQNTVIVLFMSHCHYSKQQAKNIHENIEKFKNHMIYFISDEGFSEIERFARQCSLSNISNVRFFHAPNQSLVNFKYVKSPSIYIYSPEGKLIKNWRCETAIETILQYV